MQLALQTVEALALVISGGIQNDPRPPIGLYRSGPKLESYMRSCGVMMQIGSGSRVPTLVETIIETMKASNSTALKSIVEHAADPRDFINDDAKLADVLAYLNSHLVHDGFELQRRGINVRLVKVGTSVPAVENLADVLHTINFDTVRRDLDRALASAEADPEDAVTAACSILESLCRSVLCELELPLPAQLDIKGLYKAVREPLGLAPGREDVSPEIATDVREILGGLNSTIQGIGALRTHAGDAHGRERGFRRIDARIAHLAIHAAAGAAMFIIETWQKKYPTKPLQAR